MLTLLKLITNQEPILTKSKKNNIFLKIKKNSIIGCKVTLHKSILYDFLEKLFFSISFSILNINKKSLTLIIPNKHLLNFFELKSEFFSFQNLPSIDIIIQTNTLIKKEIILLLNLFFSKKKAKIAQW